MENEKKPPEELSVEEFVMVLENMRERTNRYGDMFPLYSADYVRKLSEYETEVLDNVISILREMTPRKETNMTPEEFRTIEFAVRQELSHERERIRRETEKYIEGMEKGVEAALCVIRAKGAE